MEKKSTDLLSVSSSKGSFLRLVFERISNGLFYFVTLSIIIVSAVLLFDKTSNKTVAGYSMLGVLTDSMSPNQQNIYEDSFRSGDVLITKKTTASELAVGDIITFKPNLASDTLVTHRIIEKKSIEADGSQYFVTKGDNNNSADLPIHEQQIVAKKVLIIPKLGSFILWVQQNLLLAVISVISFLGIIQLINYLIKK
ncbi:signal peptidase I [Vagococcus zengguangii]|uniref:signal peptidase I n=1 Tax=Vagococcus zengguangii TaxID=2571750 RepID=UPI00143D63FC|nr:signal peptidase I [Vagococcus zengguangii]